MSTKALPAVASAAATFAAGFVAAGLFLLGLFDMGPLTAHMAMHIVVMNLAAPLCAIGLLGRRLGIKHPALLWAACCAQIVSIWLWHAPALQPLLASVSGSILVHGHLFVMALLFWVLLLKLAERSAWQAILALLLTGKLVCLLGVLLAFSPRALYVAAHLGEPAELADQQLAGLLMIAACPLSYLVAGVTIAARLLANPAPAMPAPAMPGPAIPQSAMSRAALARARMRPVIVATEQR